MYHGYFELILESLTKNPTAADIIVFGMIWGDFNQVFRRKNLVIKMMNISGQAAGRAVGQATSTICFRSITPQPFKIF